MTDRRQATSPDDWWDEVRSARADTPVAELMPGFDAIADLPIPYSRLPRRAHTAFAADCTRWADLAAQTPRTLLGRPKTGEATVRSLLIAAHDTITHLRSATELNAAEAVRDLLQRLDERDHILLSARMWGQHKLSRVAVAERLGVHLAWVERNQSKAAARFRDLLADPAHRAVTEHAAALGDRLGAYPPRASVEAELRRLGIDPFGDAAALLLYLAGPYTCDEQWCENTARGGRRHVDAVVDTVVDQTPTPATALTEALTRAGLAAEHADTYLASQAGLRRFGEVWVRWGGSAADKAATVLEVTNAPATAEEISAMIGDGLSLRTIREALSADDRFVRISRQAWALRRWGVDEYGGIVDEITARITAAGGAIRVDDLIEDLLRSFPDLAESSIRTFLTTLVFVADGDSVRLRTDTDGWPRVGPLSTARGAFSNGDNGIRVAVPVTTELLRGSARPLHPAVATALGIDPGGVRRFDCPHAPVTLSWRLSSTNGPNTTSLRAHADALGAAPGDTLVLVFDRRAGTVDVVRVGAHVTGIERLRQILGGGDADPREALGAALDCPPSDVEAVLRARGDDDLGGPFVPLARRTNSR